MQGNAVLNKSCTTLLLRLIHILPEENENLRTLHDNLLLFARLSEPKDDIREIEWIWARKLLNVLDNLSRCKTVGSQILVHTLFNFNKDKRKKYYFGNSYIESLLEEIAKNCSDETTVQEEINPLRRITRSTILESSSSQITSKNSEKEYI